jgi:hypothetical protein
VTFWSSLLRMALWVDRHVTRRRISGSKMNFFPPDPEGRVDYVTTPLANFARSFMGDGDFPCQDYILHYILKPFNSQNPRRAAKPQQSYLLVLRLCISRTILFLPLFNIEKETEREPNSAMSQPLEVERVGPNATDLKRFSCLTCRQRKVKCDRRNPCSNCTRAARQCSFIPPVRGKPKRRSTPKEGLHAKLKRYEELLKSYGADIEPSDNDNYVSDAETVSEPDVQMVIKDTESPKMSSGSPFAFDETKTKLISKNGSSRYFEKYVSSFALPNPWSRLANQSLAAVFGPTWETRYI